MDSILKLKDKLQKSIEKDAPPEVLKKQKTLLEKKLGKAVKQLFKSAGSEDVTSKSNAIKILQWLLAMLLEMIPVAENKYKETEGNGTAYVLMGLTKQAIEVITAINEINNSNVHSSDIMLKIFKPLFENIIQHEIHSLDNIRNEIINRFNVNEQEINKIFSTHLLNFSNYIRENYKFSKEELKTFMKEV